MESWFVTGAGGFLGSNAGVYLHGKVTTYGLVHTTAPRPKLFDHSIVGDITDRNYMQELLSAMRPTVILHTAAVSGHEACERDPSGARHVNVNATQELARIAETIGARLVLISTDSVFNGLSGHYAEDAEPAPFSTYGQTKLEGERAALAVTDALVIRANFFGWSPTGRASILEFFRDSLARGSPVSGYTDLIVSSMYVQQLLAGIWDLVGVGASKIVHVAARDAMSKYDFGCAVAHEFKLDARLITPGIAGPRSGVDFHDRDLSLDVSRFESLTGHTAPSHLEGLTLAHLDEPDVRARLMSNRRVTPVTVQFSPRTRTPRDTNT